MLFRLNLCRSGYLSYNLTNLVEAMACIVGGKDATASMQIDELDMMGVEMEDKIIVSMGGEIGDTSVGVVVIDSLAVAGVMERLLLRVEHLPLFL